MILSPSSSGLCLNEAFSDLFSNTFPYTFPNSPSVTLQHAVYIFKSLFSTPLGYQLYTDSFFSILFITTGLGQCLIHSRCLANAVRMAEQISIDWPFPKEWNQACPLPLDGTVPAMASASASASSCHPKHPPPAGTEPGARSELRLGKGGCLQGSILATLCCLSCACFSAVFSPGAELQAGMLLPRPLTQTLWALPEAAGPEDRTELHSSNSCHSLCPDSAQSCAKPAQSPHSCLKPPNDPRRKGLRGPPG